jgi:hypothetical protein
MRSSGLLKLGLVLILAALALPATASGQATRTWVSGVGDDANPCSRTAPCKTLAGAQSKTAAGGQISGLDGGGFGAVTINKSLTLDLRGLWESGILTNVSNGITVNAGVNDRVNIRGVKINGLNSNFHGIRILQARSVKITDAAIWGFNRNGVSVENANTNMRVAVRRSVIEDNGGNGVLVAPQGSSVARVTLTGNEIDDNGCGIATSRSGTDPAFNYAANCGTNGGNVSGPSSSVNAYRNSISHSEHHAVLSNGINAQIRLSQNEISGTMTAPALQAVNSGSILSFGNNYIVGNPGGNGAPTGTVAQG